MKHNEQNEHNKIERAIELLNEINTDLKDKRNDIKQKVLDKLGETECKYYLVYRDGDFGEKFKVYGIKADTYDEAFDKCDNLVNEDETDDYWLLHKDEVESLLYAFNHDIITLKDKI